MIYVMFVEDQFVVVEFNGDFSFEGYEVFWGFMDGIDLDYFSLVGGMFGENSGFQEMLIFMEFVVFGDDNFESYEIGWGFDGVVFELMSIEVVIFDVVDDIVEDYEEEWFGNEDFIIVFVGVGDDFEVVFFVSEDFESYEMVIDVVEVLQVICVVVGIFMIILNGILFSYLVFGVEFEVGFVGLFSGQINVGFFLFELEVINIDQIVI